MAKARVKVTFNDKEFQKKVTTAFNLVRQNKQMIRQIGDVAVKRIAGEGRRKKPFNKERSFPKLKPATVAKRIRLAKFNQTGKPFKPKLSNLTITGQLWNSLDFFIKQKTIIAIQFTKRRIPYRISKDKFEKQNKVNARNADLADALVDIGFVPFEAKVVQQDERLTRRINNIVKRFLRRSLRVSKFLAGQ